MGTGFTHKSEHVMRMFVYGTLQQGHGNHSLCSRNSPTSRLARVQQASTAFGDLYYCGPDGGFPYLVASKETLMTMQAGSWDIVDDLLAQERAPITVGDPTHYGKVHGQLLTFHGTARGLRQRMRDVDGLEYYQPDSLYHSHYWRMLVPVLAEDGRVYHAWTYVRNPLDGPLPAAQLIADGRWVPMYRAWSGHTRKSDMQEFIAALRAEWAEKGYDVEGGE